MKSTLSELRTNLVTALAYVVVIGAVAYLGFLLGGWLGAVLIPLTLLVAANPVITIVVIIGVLMRTAKAWEELKDRLPINDLRGSR